MLRVYVDELIAPDFDSLQDKSTSAVSSSLSSPLCPRVSVTRRTNTVAQSILLACHPTCTDNTPRTRLAHLVLLIESSQLARLLPVQRRTGAGRRGALLHEYLDRVCEATQSADLCRPTASSLTLHLLVAPRVLRAQAAATTTATIYSNTSSSSSDNVSAALAAQFYAEAFAWSTSQQQQLTRDEVQQHCKLRLGLCTVCDSNGSTNNGNAALEHVRALVRSLQRHWPLAASPVECSPTTSAMPGKRGREGTECRSKSLLVRPDTQRKCDPNDFHKLYAAMLSEVTSFSERKTLAAVSAFPTMYHLLDYVDNNVVALEHEEDGGVSGCGSNSKEHSTGGPVYRTNYGEGRAWNVVNEAIIDALVTDYREGNTACTAAAAEEDKDNASSSCCSDDDDV